jgi:hypothetical protein
VALIDDLTWIDSAIPGFVYSVGEGRGTLVVFPSPTEKALGKAPEPVDPAHTILFAIDLIPTLGSGYWKNVMDSQLCFPQGEFYS